MDRVVLFVLPAAILLPSLRVGGWSLSPRFEIVAAAGFTICWVAAFALRGKVRVPGEAMGLRWFAGLLTLVLLAVLVGIVFLDYAPSARDTSELLRVIAYGTLFWLGVRFGRRGAKSSAIIVCLLGAATIALSVGFLQYGNVLGINNWLTPLYTATQLRGLVVHQRILGTFSNPNEFGMFLVLPAAVSLGITLLSSRRRHRILSWILLATFAVGIVLTGSRTALASLLIVVFAIFLFAAPRLIGAATALKMFFRMLAVGALAALVVTVFEPSQAVRRIAEISDIRQASSWQARVEDWADDYQLWLASPVTGWGPGEADMESTVDNEWLLIMRRYGILGLVWFVVGGMAAFVVLLRLLGMARPPGAKILAVALIGMIPACAFYMLFAAVYHAPQLMPPLLLVLGVTLAGASPSSQKTSGDVQCA